MNIDPRKANLRMNVLTVCVQLALFGRLRPWWLARI